MKTEKTIKILGLANLSQLKKGEDAVGYGKDGKLLPTRDQVWEKYAANGTAPAAKGYKGKSAFTRPAKIQEPTLEAVKAAIETADNMRSTKALRKLQVELTEAKAKSVKEAARREAQLALVVIPEAFKGKEGNLLTEAEVLNRLGQPTRDHAKVIAAIKRELSELNQLPSFKEQSKIFAEFKKANGKPSAQLIAKAEANVAICDQAEAEVNSRLEVAYTEGDTIAAQVDVAQAAAKIEYAALLAAANVALKGENLKDVAHAAKLAAAGVTRHDESLALLTDAISRIEKGERLMQNALQKGSLKELLAMYKAPEPETVTPRYVSVNPALQAAINTALKSKTDNTLLDMIDEFYMVEDGDVYVPADGMDEFISDDGTITINAEHSAFLLDMYTASLPTAEIQLTPAKVTPPATDTPPAVNKKTRTKTPSKGTKVATTKPASKSKLKNA